VSESNPPGEITGNATPVLIPAPLADPENSGLWLSLLAVQEGQAVESGQFLARLESKGQVFNLTSPRAGHVVGLHVRPGQVVQPKEVLCYIGPQSSIPAAQPTAQVAAATAFDPTALLIFGGGGHGKTIIDLVRALGSFRIIGIIDDGLTPGSDVMDTPVLGGAQTLEEWHARGVRLAANCVGGIGNVDVRLRVFERLAKAGFTCPALVHPSAVVERSAALEPGVQVLAQAYIGSDVRVGFGTVINAGGIVSHDCTLGKVVNLSPGATLAGNVHVENYTQIGMRATVNLGITIGERCLLGNGCTVKKDVPANTRVRAGTIWPIPR
jgi:acetyltransferase EpsM